MARFGWAYVDSTGTGSGSAGPIGSVQFMWDEASSRTTGSAYLTYYTASGVQSYLPNSLILSGNLYVTGTISASTFHIKDVITIDATGSTDFGDSKDDHHFRTGSFVITNAGVSPTAYLLSASVVDNRINVGGRLTASHGLHVNQDDYPLVLGAGSDLKIVHDGTISKISNATGHFVIDNEATDKHIRLRLGEDNADTAVQIRNNSDNSVWGCDAQGNVSGSGTLQAVGNAFFGGTLSVSGTSTFSGVATHAAHPIFNTGITIKNADASAGYINFYEQSSNGTNVCTFRGKSSMGNCTITLPGDTGTVVLEDNTVTLSNKTIASPTITGDLNATGDTNTFSSANSTDPLVVIKNTTNDANSARLRFVKDKGAAGADNDVVGLIEFYGDDDNQDNIEFGRIEVSVADASNGAEGGRLKLQVATHDGELQPGLTIADGDAEDEVDVTIGNGAASLVTVAGLLSASAAVSGLTGTFEEGLSVGGSTVVSADKAIANVTTVSGSGGVSGLTGTFEEGLSVGNSTVISADKAIANVTTVSGSAAVSGLTGTFEEGLSVGNATVISADKAIANVTTVSGSGGVSGLTGTFEEGVSVGNSTIIDADKNLTNLGSITATGDLTVTGDTHTLQSANSTDPLVIIKNTTNDANGARLRFVKDKGAAGAANDICGIIEFFGDDASQDNICFASITASVAVHTNGQEGGKLAIGVAEHDGTMTNGLTLTDGNANGEIDVTIGAGADSLTTIAGDLDIPNGGFALGSDASGDMYYNNSSGILTRIAVGSDNHVLTLDGAVPGWETVSAGSVAADDISAGDAAVSIATTSGNITLDAQATNADIIFKVDDADSSITALTLDGSEAGAAIFNSTISGAAGVSGLTGTFEEGLSVGGSTVISADKAIAAVTTISGSGAVSGFTGTFQGGLSVGGSTIIDEDKAIANVTTVAVTTSIKTPLIEYTDGDDAITIADGGGVTFSSTVKLVDDKTLTFGSNDDWTIEYDENGDDDLVMTGTTFEMATDTATFTSANATDPLVIIKNTTNDTGCARLRFVKDKGAAGAANDDVGIIQFYGDDANQDQVLFGRIRTRVAVHTNGQEGGKMQFAVASHDGELNAGLTIGDGDAEDEVDVTIGNGAASVVSAPGFISGAVGLAGLALTIGGAGNRGIDEDSQASLNGLNVNSGGISNAGAVGGATTISGSGAAEAFSFAAEGGFKVLSTTIITEDKQIRARLPHVTHHAFAIGTAGERFIPFVKVGDVPAPGSATEETQMVAAFDGRLIRVIWRPQSEQSGGDTRIALYKNTNGNAVIAAGGIVEFLDVTCSGNASTSNVFNFTGSSHFSAGDVVGVSVNPENGPDDVNMVCIWEYDMTGL